MRREYPVAEEKAVAHVVELNSMLFALAHTFQATTVHQRRSRLGDLMNNLQMM